MKKLIIFRDGGYPPPPPFAGNSAKIINLIFEPFPRLISIMSKPIKVMVEVIVIVVVLVQKKVILNKKQNKV